MDTEGQAQAHRLMILGAGATGSGIAALAVKHGVPVVLVDPDGGALERARGLVLESAAPDELVAARFVAATSVHAGGEVTAVVEAVTERAVVKAKALSGACAVVRPGTPLLSATATIPIDELADWAGRPQDVMGANFGLAHRDDGLVELVLGKRTGDIAAETALGLLRALGRTVVAIGDAPGFVTGRLLYPLINTAARIVAEGVASVERVDAVMSHRLAQQIGPLRIADLIGLDSLVDSLEAMHERTGDESCRPCPLLLEKVLAGELGQKTGRGFYGDYGAGDVKS